MANENLTSGAIHFTGLGNGTDFESIIEASVQAQSFHKNRLEVWKASWEQKVEAFDLMTTSMVQLKTHMESMDTMDEFLKKSVASSNSAILTATATSSAEVGNHSVLVNQVAQNKIITNKTGYASKDTSINSTGSTQTIVVDYKGVPMSVDIPDGTTLQTAINLINKDPDNEGVRASAVFDGTNYYMQIRGMDMGDDSTLTTAGSTLAGYGYTGLPPAEWDINQENQDAQIRVDGWPPATAAEPWITSDSNTITDAVTGISMTLKATGTVAISVLNDTEAVKENVRSFIEKVNEVRSLLQTLTAVDTDSGEGSILTGNYGLQMISSKLKTLTATKAIGFSNDETDDFYSTLGHLGIGTDAEEGSPTNGLLVMDEVKFDEALANNPESLAEVFAADHEGVSDSPDFAYNSHIDGLTKAGTYEVSYTTDAGGAITSATIGGETATISGTQIMGPAGTDVAGLVIDVTNLTPSSTQTGNLRIKLGKAGEMSQTLDELLDTEDGPLVILKRNYTYSTGTNGGPAGGIIYNIQKKIDYETTRIANYEATLRLRFSRLEATLGQYESIKTSLESQLSQLSTS